MNSWVVLVCEGVNDEAVGGALITRLIGAPDARWNWHQGANKSRAWLYWHEWEEQWAREKRYMRATLAMPDYIKQLRQHRGEALMAIKVAYMIQREIPCAAIIMLRDTDGKAQREQAWRVFQQFREEVVVGLAKNSIESWVMACWKVNEHIIRDAIAWVKQNRGSEFNPFAEPDRLTPTLSKRLLDFLGCTTSEDYAAVVTAAFPEYLQNASAGRAGLREFVEQVETKLAFLVD